MVLISCNMDAFPLFWPTGQTETVFDLLFFLCDVVYREKETKLKMIPITIVL